MNLAISIVVAAALITKIVIIVWFGMLAMRYSNVPVDLVIPVERGNTYEI